MTTLLLSAEYNQPAECCRSLWRNRCLVCLTAYNQAHDDIVSTTFLFTLSSFSTVRLALEAYRGPNRAPPTSRSLITPPSAGDKQRHTFGSHAREKPLTRPETWPYRILVSVAGDGCCESQQVTMRNAIPHNECNADS